MELDVESIAYNLRHDSNPDNEETSRHAVSGKLEQVHVRAKPSLTFAVAVRCIADVCQSLFMGFALALESGGRAAKV